MPREGTPCAPLQGLGWVLPHCASNFDYDGAPEDKDYNTQLSDPGDFNDDGNLRRGHLQRHGCDDTQVHHKGYDAWKQHVHKTYAVAPTSQGPVGIAERCFQGSGCGLATCHASEGIQRTAITPDALEELSKKNDDKHNSE